MTLSIDCTKKKGQTLCDVTWRVFFLLFWSLYFVSLHSTILARTDATHPGWSKNGQMGRTTRLECWLEHENFSSQASNFSLTLFTHSNFLTQLLDCGHPAQICLHIQHLKLVQLELKQELVELWWDNRWAKPVSCSVARRLVYASSCLRSNMVTRSSTGPNVRSDPETAKWVQLPIG